MGCNLIPHDGGQNLAHRSVAVYSWLRGAGHILRWTRVHVALNTLVPVSLIAAAVVVVVVVAAVVVLLLLVLLLLLLLWLFLFLV